LKCGKVCRVAYPHFAEYLIRQKGGIAPIFGIRYCIGRNGLEADQAKNANGEYQNPNQCFQQHYTLLVFGGATSYGHSLVSPVAVTAGSHMMIRPPGAMAIRKSRYVPAVAPAIEILMLEIELARLEVCTRPNESNTTEAEEPPVSVADTEVAAEPSWLERFWMIRGATVSEPVAAQELAALSKLTTQLDFYVPDRYKEGYGISKQGRTNELRLIASDRANCSPFSIDSAAVRI